MLVEDEVNLLLAAGAAVNDATLEVDETGEWDARGDPTEVALLVAAEKVGVRAGASRLERLGEVPFESGRKLMSSIHPVRGAWSALADVELYEASVVQFTKGAPDVLLDRCHSVLRAGAIEPLDDVGRRRFDDAIDAFAREGFRTHGRGDAPPRRACRIDSTVASNTTSCCWEWSGSSIRPSRRRGR